MVNEAQQHASEDEHRKQEIETRNQADNMAYTAEKTLRDLGDKVPENVRTDVEAKAQALRDAVQSNDVSQMQRRMEELSQAMQQIGQAAYQQQPGGETPPGGEQPGGGPGEEDGTVEGEFREV